jgi:hypothetical protein
MTPPFNLSRSKALITGAGSPTGIGFASAKLLCEMGASVYITGASDRLNDRKSLLSSVDRLRRDMDNSGTLSGLDALSQQAFNILTSSELVDALDISKEPESVRERYGKGDPNRFGDGAPRNLEHFLMARRLVEAGCRVVTLNFGRWDFHSDNFNGMKNTHLPQFDQGLSALIEDLHLRGMDKDVAVIAWGEFGRTPTSQGNDGRDHNHHGFTVWMAGGGVKGGMTHGATDDYGYEAVDKRMHIHDWHATLLHLLGLDHERLTYRYAGRDFRLTDVHGTVAREIIT